MPLTQKQIQHFYLRTGFGETPQDLAKRKNLTKQQLVDGLFVDSKRIQSLVHIQNPIEKEVKNIKELRKSLNSKKKTEELDLEWLKRMASTEAQLREKMTFFWHNHFATKMPLAYLMQEQNNTFRTHALGSFRDLLHAVSTDSAMLLFLNNQQNRKLSPNENFAREVMELFTLGEGNYTEQDVKQAARAFTGWHVNKLGKFEINKQKHDEGVKTFFGRTGNLGGAEVIDMLLDNKDTARYICRKLYRFLINHTENNDFIEHMTEEFYGNDYNIEKLLRLVLLSDEFYLEKNVGVRVASPTELLVRYLRVFKLKFKIDKAIFRAQKVLGQVLFFPPNVAGWSEQMDWVDSSSLLYRMRLPLVFFGDYEMKSNAKQDPEESEMSGIVLKALGWQKPEADWKGLLSVQIPQDESAMIEYILELFIQSRTDSIDRASLKKVVDSSSKQARVKSLTMHVMALPEYQLI
jgi:uncharacterized protein (DUF1800 family)